MKAIGKPVFSLLLCLVLLAGLFPAAAFAEEPVGADAPGGPSQPQANPAGVPIDAANFPDELFRAYVAESLDPDRNGTLTDEEIARVTQINCGGRGISSLQGIEYFTALKVLSCGNNQLTELDLSANPALTVLFCEDNQLTSLDLSANTALTDLYCYDNQLTSLDLSANTALTGLSCGHNQLTSLDLSANTALTDLHCSNNRLTSLDLNAIPDLTYLNCGSNQLTSLDLSANPALTGLWCYYNQLTSLDLSANTALTYLYCFNNQLTSLDLSANTALTYLYCHNNPLTSLDVSANTALTVLLCSNNQLTELDVSANTALTMLDCGSNQLTSLDLSANPALTGLYCLDNQLTSLDLSANTALTELRCFDNRLTSLDVSANPALNELWCEGNQLTSLDLSANTALTDLQCYGNRIESLDLRPCPVLAEAARGEGVIQQGYPETALFYGAYHPYEGNPDYTRYHLGVDASTELITDDTPETVKEDLKEIPEDATPEEIRETAKNLDDDALGEALLDDSVAETVKALEEQTGTGVGIKVTPELKEKFDESQVAILGAALNTPEDPAADIILMIGPASDADNHVVPVDYSSQNALFFSMTLENVENAKALEVPVRIDLPVPEGMNANTVVLLHYTGEGMPEVIKPQAVTENGVTLLRFVLTGFSDFALAAPARTAADVNADGTVNGKDLIILRRYVAGVEGTVINELNADLNGDGTVNGKDLILLRRLLAG